MIISVGCLNPMHFAFRGSYNDCDGNGDEEGSVVILKEGRHLIRGSLPSKTDNGPEWKIKMYIGEHKWIVPSVIFD